VLDLEETNIKFFRACSTQAEDNIQHKTKRWKPMSKRPIGIPKTLSEDDVLEDIKSISIGNWEKVAQNRDIWKKAVEQDNTVYRL